MGGNYEKGMYNQLMEVMARLDAVKRDLHTGARRPSPGRRDRR